MTAGDAVYVATYLSASMATDPDMAARVEAHRARRPSSWSTVESADLPAAVREHPGHTLLVESLTTWVGAATSFDVDIAGLVSALAAHDGDAVIVSDEVGLGVHPETELGRRFRDVLGEVNRAVADVADDVLLVVAGRVLRLPSS